ncbi:MAG: Uma2 family endonuclease [Gomphosphaeria aponina SAG 52.96 = DSM 107014]|uniref:Uma2 family endonuclease n=1 Tax=Gomphosphaeria aponina SAG 52.96 = DSM 107014 TaxID=1521640 RepID=A0A941GTM6_9CHRO|nr:Uma2 family endonuclease [Gomphosphaeria aponina SAG 52.96 = DSM 107014]
MIETIKPVTWTTEDLELLPEGTNYEIIEGDLFITRSPHRKHQQICGLIFTQLNLWSKETGLGETIIAPGIIFSDINNVIPDVVWLSKNRLAQIEDEAGHLLGAPELIVEVISAGRENEKRDREVKVKLYSVQGVQEYWICDRFRKQVEVYRREKAQLKLVATLFENDELISPLLPNFSGIVHLFFPE